MAQGVQESYPGHRDLLDRILAALESQGLHPESLAPEDLAPIEFLHSRGRRGSLELLEQVKPSAGARMLDIGGGLGGSARFAAREAGLDVMVLDLMSGFCSAGHQLTRLVGSSDSVRFVCGNAIRLPFRSGVFDVAWLEHATMNIERKDALFVEVRRVLRPHGRLAMHEVLLGEEAEPVYPTPWAPASLNSHLVSEAALRSMVSAVGLREIWWRDVTAESANWLGQRLGQRTGSGSFGLELVLGDAAGEMLQNMHANLSEERVRVVQAIYRSL
jgi:SAM-dependent methyltransferase